MLLTYKNIYRKVLLHFNADNTDARGLHLVLTTWHWQEAYQNCLRKLCLTLSEDHLEAFRHLGALENRMSDACALP